MPFDDALIDPISFVSEHVTDILFSGESIDSLIHNCILSSSSFNSQDMNSATIGSRDY